MTVSMGDQAVTILLSEVYDPVPDLIRWLESLVTGVKECSFVIDEEGKEKTLNAICGVEDSVYFNIDDPKEKNQNYVSGLCVKRQLVEEFYCGLKKFASSPEYDKEEWESETLGERIEEATSIDKDTLLNSLASCGKEELEKLFFKAAPAYTLEAPGVVDESERYRKCLTYMMDSSSDGAGNGVIEVPDPITLSDRFDSLTTGAKRKELASVFDYVVSGFEGTCLSKISSPVIDEYLASGSDNE